MKLFWLKPSAKQLSEEKGHAKFTQIIKHWEEPQITGILVP